MAVAFGFRGSGRRGGTPALPVRLASLVVEPGGTSVSTHGLGYLFTALRRQGLIAVGARVPSDYHCPDPTDYI
jgi:hypothetical protein